MVRVKSDEAKRAKCGLVDKWKCAANKAGLKECEDCKLIKRVKDRWKMINRKPYKLCIRCGEFLPVDMFYRKTIKKPNGVVYEALESTCKLCRSRMRHEALGE